MLRKDFLGLVLLLLLGGAVSALLRGSKPIGVNVGASSIARAVMMDSRSPAMENRRADLTLAVFTDYQCPVCRRSDPIMRRAAARDGKVRILYKDWPILGQRSLEAARVALAARYQGIYPAVHHELMSTFPLDRPMLKAAVERAGGDWSKVERDLEAHGRAIDDQLALNANQAMGLGLGGTPR